MVIEGKLKVEKTKYISKDLKINSIDTAFERQTFFGVDFSSHIESNKKLYYLESFDNDNILKEILNGIENFHRNPPEAEEHVVKFYMKLLNEFKIQI